MLASISLAFECVLCCAALESPSFSVKEKTDVLTTNWDIEAISSVIQNLHLGSSSCLLCTYVREQFQV